MKNLCIIPARGGSRRIPGKNIKLFCGKPLIVYSIEAARNTRLFDRIIVSTDSEEIIRVAVEAGAEAPFRRPSELADDYATTSDVILHGLKFLKEAGDGPTHVCLLYATAPFVRAEYISNGYQAMLAAGATSAIAVTTFPYPIFRGFRLNEAQRLEMIWPEHLRTRSQDLPEAYHEAGQFYWSLTDAYFKHKSFLTPDTFPVILPRHVVQDIDTAEDWECAESMFRVLKERGLVS
jgi:pseudaminic acid cytidylyltransferase